MPPLLMPPLGRLDLLRNVVDILPVGVWILDETGKILYGNSAGHRIWAGARYVGVEQYGEYKGWWVATGKRIEAEEWGAARAIRNGETSIDEEVEIECFDGTRKIILHSAMPIRDEDDNIVGAVIVNHDITERKRFEERLREMTERDPLTNTYNRRHLYAILERESERARRYGTALSVVMFDIDHFKTVNDTHGHLEGDRVLVRIAEIVQQELRSVDLLARYGGEEFLIVAPGIDRPRAVVLAERLRTLIAAADFDPVPQITCSFGVHQFDGEDTDSIFRYVDDLLYKAKQQGRNCVVTE
jgi:diguanylate cyclase (GGDEF)-like protein